MPTFLDSSGIELKLAVIKYVVKFSFKWPTEKIYKNMVFLEPGPGAAWQTRRFSGNHSANGSWPGRERERAANGEQEQLLEQPMGNKSNFLREQEQHLRNISSNLGNKSSYWGTRAVFKGIKAAFWGIRAAIWEQVQLLRE